MGEVAPYFMLFRHRDRTGDQRHGDRDPGATLVHSREHDRATMVKMCGGSEAGSGAPILLHHFSLEGDEEEKKIASSKSRIQEGTANRFGRCSFRKSVAGPVGGGARRRSRPRGHW